VNILDRKPGTETLGRAAKPAHAAPAGGDGTTNAAGGDFFGFDGRAAPIPVGLPAAGTG